MKKSTLALALALVALWSVSWAATHPDSSREPQKGQPTPNPDSLNLNSSRSNIYRVKVTHVSADKTFTVEVTFAAKNLKDPFPREGDVIDVIYNPPPTPGDPPAATTVKGSKSNSSYRVAPGQDLSSVTGTVMQVNALNKTFSVGVTFSAEELTALPKVGKIYDITYTETTTAGGPLKAKRMTQSDVIN